MRPYFSSSRDSTRDDSAASCSFRLACFARRASRAFAVPWLDSSACLTAALALRSFSSSSLSRVAMRSRRRSLSESTACARSADFVASASSVSSWKRRTLIAFRSSLPFRDDSFAIDLYRSLSASALDRAASKSAMRSSSNRNLPCRSPTSFSPPRDFLSATFSRLSERSRSCPSSAFKSEIRCSYRSRVSLSPSVAA